MLKALVELEPPRERVDPGPRKIDESGRRDLTLHWAKNSPQHRPAACYIRRMLSDKDLADLRRAKELLEHRSFAIRLADLAGSPIEWGLSKLPGKARDAVERATHAALEKALEISLRTLEPRAKNASSDWLHRGLVTASGGVGGAFGVAALPIELPLSTMLMLRSIADHARAHGEDLDDVEARLACLTVFSLGGASPDDDAAETGYFAMRAALARSVAEAAAFVAQRSALDATALKGAPVMARLLAVIAKRFGATVGKKAVAQSVPVLGAIGGATINLVFIDHFQDVAEGHFTVRRLERVHGAEDVRRAYDAFGPV